MFIRLRDSYSPNQKRSKKKLWDDLGSLRMNFLDLPWLVMGDFKNPLLDNHKVVGLNPVLRVDLI